MSAAPTATTLATALAVDGFGVVDGLLDAAQCDALVAAIERDADVFAPRRWLGCPAVARVASQLLATPALAGLLPETAVALQCTLFDKSTGRDWSVGPHQDLSMPVAGLPDAIAAPLPRTVKDGIDVVQPPPHALEALLAVRVQLDTTAQGSGALEVFAGTHRRGRLEDADLQALDPRRRLHVDVPRGGALLMRPLLVHASRRMNAPMRRRVLHFLFGPSRPSMPC